MKQKSVALAPGALYVPGFLDRTAREALVAELRALLLEAPLFQPCMPRTGKPFSVKMTNLGPLGWVSDQAGYRYQELHPDTGRPWPDVPPSVLSAWEQLADYPHPPEACLVNWYGDGAKMGLHQDKDEGDFDAPVVSLSLGDTALFRVGGTDRRDRTSSVKLQSGDAFVLGGASRLAFHGVDRVIAQSSTLLPQGGRINLTLRRVTPPG